MGRTPAASSIYGDVDSRCAQLGRSPRHRTSYLYAKADTAKSSNVRRALRTVDDRENRNAWVDEGECSVQVRAGRVSESSRREASGALPWSRASRERPPRVSAGPAAP